MTDVVEMDYEVILSVADSFIQDAEECRRISKILEGIINALKSSMIGALINAQQIAWLEGIQKALNNLAEVCDEFGGDLTVAQAAHERGDLDAMHVFGEGV